MTAEIHPDSAHFGAMYAEHFRSVWRTLQRLGVFPAFIDDAAQEVFVTAWRRWSEFQGRSTERTWLLGIALRVASDVRRKQRPTDDVPLKLAMDAPLPDAVTAAKQKSKRVEALLQQLDEERREVLLLCDVEGYTIPEVAEATGVNLNTLYTRLRTARQQFEALVKREREEL